MKNVLVKSTFSDLAYLLNTTISFIAYSRINPHCHSPKAIIKRFFYGYEFKNIEPYFDQEIFISSVTQRPNYLNLIKNTTSHKKDSAIYFPEASQKKNYALKNILYAIYWFWKQCISNHKTWSLKELLFIASEISITLNTIDFLEKNYKDKIKCKKFLCFDATFGHDALLVSLFKRFKIPTYSLQHSFFFKFKSFIPEEIIKYDVNYPDYYLFWSQKQIDVVVKNFGALPHNLLIAGNPNYRNKEIPIVKQTFRKCLVLLSRFYYHKENLLLLKELSKMENIEFDIRPHPSLKEIPEQIDFNEYINTCNLYGFTLDENKKVLGKVFRDGNYDFSICFNTAAYFDSLSSGLICFRYAFNENEDFEGLDDKFITQRQLIEKIEDFKKQSPEALREKISTILNEAIGTDTFEYPNIL